MFRSQKDKRKKEEQEVLMKRRASMLDRYQKVFDKLEENRDDIEDNFERLTTGSAQQDQELTKVVEAIKGAQNVNNSITKTLQKIVIVLKKQAELIDMQEQTSTSGISEAQMDQLREIVEKSKLADSPQKRLSSLDRKYEDTYQDMSDLVKSIERIDDQMSVNSLNAAVEAGKVGPRGRKLIRAAEDVRSLSEDYTETTKSILEIFNTFSELMDETRERVDDLAECVQGQTELLEHFLKEQEEASDGAASLSYSFGEEADRGSFTESYGSRYGDDYEETYENDSDDFDDEYEKYYGSASDESESKESEKPKLEKVPEEKDEEEEEKLEDADYDEEEDDDEPLEEHESSESEEAKDEIMFHFDPNGDIHDAIEGIEEVLDAERATSEHHQQAVQQMISAGETFMEQQKVMQRLENIYETISESIHQVYKDMQDEEEAV
ncbi:MAG: methyl-accepting chemotaxis protein [Lachnospiraceae bacterium]